MARNGWWARVREARLVHVLVVYLGASWAILEGVDLLRDIFLFPAWVGPTAFLLLVIGLVVILATAWVQSLPETDRRERAREVPGTWQVGLGDLKQAIASGRLPHLTWGRALLGGIFAFSLLFGFAGAYVLIRDRGRGLAPVALVAGEAAPGIAVLPFEVRGPGGDVWHEGMVDVLSKSLDGAAGLRTIDSRTVLARWREEVGSGATPDAPGALEVARRTGARYAVLGSVVLAGERLRAVADAFDLETERRLGEAQTEGPADSVFAVVDRFAGEILRRIVGERGEIPALDLSRATTASLPALKAYLEGEALLRRSRFEEAVRAYQRAVAADSTFALAWLRLGDAYGWLSPPDFALSEEAGGRAARLYDRLPERDALLARGAHGILRGSPQSLEALRTATRKYPEDALAWYLLGDFVFHNGGALLADPAERRLGFEKAIELDPTFTPAYLHAVHDALRSEPDSAHIAGMIETYARLAPGTVEGREFRLVHAIAFGDDGTRARAMAALDTISGVFRPYTAHQNLSHPGFLDRKAAVLAAARESADPGEAALAAADLATTLIHRGELAAAMAAVEHPLVDGAAQASILYPAHVSGLPVPIERLERTNAGPPGGEPDPTVLFVRGALAIERGRGEEYEGIRRTLQGLAEETLARDSLAARHILGAARGLAGYAARRRGQAAEGERLLEEARHLTAGGAASSPTNQVVRWWQAGAALESGRLERAARLLLSLAHGESFAADPMAVLELARLEERLGRPREARADYEWFALAWRDADPELQPLVEEARVAAIRLTDLPSE